MPDQDVLEHVKREATTKWKWKNPLLAAVLAFVFGPLGYLYFSWQKALFGLVISIGAAEVSRYVGYWPPAWWVRFVALGLFAFYAYIDTRFMNAAIEYYKHGLPGTGFQKPLS